jgi:hypothetical protein
LQVILAFSEKVQLWRSEGIQGFFAALRMTGKK